jgi:RNA polymerase sigma-70 factor (ECF subfamily)
MTEIATILQAREGNRDAFRSLYEEHREKIFRLAYRYTRSAEDAEDVLQETFIKAFKGLNSFDPDQESNFSAWISKIGLHCALDHLRRSKKRKGADHVSLSDLPQDPAASDPEPDRTVAAARAWEWVREAQHRLPPRQQVIFDLRYRQHLDIKEIAAQMDCGESNVKTQLSRAVDKLRKQLEPAWGKP